MPGLVLGRDDAEGTREKTIQRFSILVFGRHMSKGSHKKQGNFSLRLDCGATMQGGGGGVTINLLGRGWAEGGPVGGQREGLPEARTLW